jgi:hypothetical protein
MIIPQSVEGGIKMEAKTMNKKGAFMDDLTGLGIGIVTLAIVVGIGAVVLVKFGEAAPNADNETSYLRTQLGSSGLSGWVPAVIALVIGILFLGAFLGRGRKF